MGDAIITASAPLSRALAVTAGDVAAESEDRRTITLSFSSEEPAKQTMLMPGEKSSRQIWEILDHSEEACDLTYLRQTGAFLFGHDPKMQLGTLDDVAVTPDRKGRAIARFGRGELAREKFQDVQDGILRGASVTYNWVQARKEGTRDGLDVIRVTKWQPLEVSLGDAARILRLDGEHPLPRQLRLRGQ